MKIQHTFLATSPIDMGATWTSSAIFVGTLEHYSVQLEFIGTPVGEFSLECSNDKGHHERADGGMDTGLNTFTQIKGSAINITEAGNHVWTARSTGYRWVRVKWIMAPGDGEIVEAQFVGKGL